MKRLTKIEAIVMFGGGALVGAAVARELRMPTVERFRTAWWNPEDVRVLTPCAFGMGWTVNGARLNGMLHERRAARQGTNTVGDDTEAI